MTKQVILVREDLDMSKGKCVAQGSHVSVLATREADDETVQDWIDEGGKKIVLTVESEEQLLNILNSIDDVPTAKIRDLGYTELEPNTLTAGAVGPANEDKIDTYTGHLDLFK
jgi:conserved hypothetical protein TIGR00283